MFQIKRGCEIGSVGNNETAFEKTINFFKNDVGCAEISRTGQAADKSLTVELKYRDFQNFSLKMSTYSYKAQVVRFGAKSLSNAYLLGSAEERADVVLSENLFVVLVSNYFFALGKSNFGTNLLFPTWNTVISDDGNGADTSRSLKLFPQARSNSGKIMVLDVFCPNFDRGATGDTINFDEKIVGIENVSGIAYIPVLSRFSVDGQEYVKITNELCVEVTS